MARDTFGEIFDSRKDEVLSVDQVWELVAAKLVPLQKFNDAWVLMERAVELGKESPLDNIRIAALYSRVAEIQPLMSGASVLAAKRYIDREVVESCRRLVLSVYGEPEVEEPVNVVDLP